MAESGNQIKADLSWVRSSPPLVCDPRSWKWPDPSEHPESGTGRIQAFMETNRAPRVGRYFEELVYELLMSLPDTTNVSRNLPLKEGRETAGEIDFLFRCRQHFIHLEVAVKFYLWREEADRTGSHLIGPNPSDRFEAKWERLSTRQLALARRMIPEIDQDRILLHGIVFYPLTMASSPVLPSVMNPQHHRGFWVRRSELHNLEESMGGCRAVLLEKPFWLAAPVGVGNEIPGAPWREFRSQAEAHFRNHMHPVTASVLSPGEDGWKERSRIFIVSDSWPQDEQKSVSRL